MDDVGEWIRGVKKKKGKGKIKSKAAQTEWRLMFPMAERNC